jgi:hypothetical protein
MGAENSLRPIDFASRLRRSRGRSGRTSVASAKVTPDEHKELEDAAGAEGKALGEWGREVLLAAARQPKDDALFTELVATRLLLVNLLKPMLLGKPVPENWIAEATSGVRSAKHKAAAELRREYASRTRKEVNNGHTMG